MMMSFFLSMFLLFFHFSSFLLTCLLKENSYSIGFDIFELNDVSFGLYFLFDFYSMMFFSVVCLISGVVFSYSVFYMGKMSTKRFLFKTIFFVLSMFLLIFSSNLISMMLGWDGLGMTSFLLVTFYMNEVSIKSALLTIMLNRVGDAGMILFIAMVYLNSLTFWNMMFLNKYNYWFYMIFMIACFTKSAQYPFMSWLPAAMTAPTPISSLVHSSTLVTAGIYLLIRMNYIFFFENLFYFLKIMGVMTMFLGSMMACIEMDYKKVIAYSTLSQLGLMTFILGFGEIYLSFFQLISHAIFKSLLFMCVGVVMSSGFGNQDSRIMGKNVINNYFLMVLIGFCCLNLSGFPLLMGFFSKDLILEILFSESTNFLILIIFLISCVFSVSYSVKIYFNSFYMMNFGSSISSFFYLKKELAFLFLLFFFMSFMGMISEEFLTMDYLYSFEQSMKILDFSLIMMGIVFHIYLTNMIKKSKLWNFLLLTTFSDFFYEINFISLNQVNKLNFLTNFMNSNFSFFMLINLQENKYFLPKNLNSSLNINSFILLMVLMSFSFLYMISNSY